MSETVDTLLGTVGLSWSRDPCCQGRDQETRSVERSTSLFPTVDRCPSDSAAGPRSPG